MLGSMSKWIYDKNPTEALKFEEPLAELKSSIAESGSKVFQDMIQDILLSNSHRTTVEMYPSKTLEEEELKVSVIPLCTYSPIKVRLPHTLMLI